jgi:hypothetical protein
MNVKLKRLTGAIRKACAEVYGKDLVSVVLFGSWARETATPASDVDLVVVSEGLAKGRMARVRQFREVEKRIEGARLRVWGGAYAPPELSPLFKTREEARVGSPLFLDMTDRSILLYDRDAFFSGILDAVRARMRANGTRRVAAKGGYYWLYRPGSRLGEAIEL